MVETVRPGSPTPAVANEGVHVKDSGGRGRRPKPDAIDVLVGRRLRLRREMLRLSQQQVADALGISFQQIQKYERGVNRVGASRLHQLSHALDAPVSFFFDDTDLSIDPAGPGCGAAAKPLVEPRAGDDDPLSRAETTELVRAYYAIADPAVRRILFEFARGLALHLGARKPD
ncbi:MAG: helix-turn-helix transcriptional regulator [Alphaproteobacteria bacterium]|nr:helix-turn-helix transcriptional regulator [Alphaproteobacteria bacterium]